MGTRLDVFYRRDDEMNKNNNNNLNIPISLLDSPTDDADDFEFGTLRFLTPTIVVSRNGPTLLVFDVDAKHVRFSTRLFAPIRDYTCCRSMNEIFLICADRTLLRLGSTPCDEAEHRLGPRTGLESTSRVFLNSGKSLFEKWTSKSETRKEEEVGDKRNLFAELRRSFYVERGGGNEQTSSTCSGYSTPEILMDEFSRADVDEAWILNKDQENSQTNDKSLPDSILTSPPEVSVFRRLMKKKDEALALFEKAPKESEESVVSLHPVDKLATPTEEQYLKNRFNPFHHDDYDNRVELEKMLDNSLTSGDLAKQVELVLTPDDDEEPTTTKTKSVLRFSSVKDDQEEAPDFNAALFSRLDNCGLRPNEEFPTMQKYEEFSIADDEDAADDLDPVSLESMCSTTSATDIWNQFKTDFVVSNLVSTSNYICCVDSKRNLHFSTLDESTNLVWKTWADVQEPDVRVDQLCASSDGAVVWRRCGNVAQALLNSRKKTPTGSGWAEAAPNVDFISVCSNSAWYLRCNGDICCQLDLGRRRPTFKAFKVACGRKVVRLSCSDVGHVFALTDLGLVLYRFCAKPADRVFDVDVWTELSLSSSVPSNRFVSLSTYNDFCWFLDENRRLFFLDATCSKRSNFWQYFFLIFLVSTPETLNNNRGGQVSVASTSSGLYLTESNRIVHFCRCSLTGHIWTQVVPNQFRSVATFCRLSVSHVFDEKADFIWLQRENVSRELVAYQVATRRFSTVSTPTTDCRPVDLSCSIGVVWLLDEQGRIFVRKNQANTNDQWTTLDVSQLIACEVGRLVCLCCTLDSVWACDQFGHVYVRLGVEATTENGLTPAWMALENRDAGESPIRRLYCSPDANFVWASTMDDNILVRFGISASLPIGLRWISVGDLKAKQLAVSFKCVWALSGEGEVFCRRGIEENNPGGNYWRKIPGRLTCLSSSPTNQLWGLNLDGRLVRHVFKYRQTCTFITASSDDTSNSDFEII